MRKILLSIILGLFISNTASYAAIKGTGVVKMSDRAVNHFIDYIHGKSNFKKKVGNTKPKPDMFILSSNGDWTSGWFCPWTKCVDALSRKTIKECERVTKTLCGVFAVRRTLYWDNGINNKKNKTKFNSKMSATEIREKLKQLGFIEDDKKKSEKTKKKTVKESKNKKLIENLKELNELLEAGVINKEEFEKAKKKILN